MKGEALSLQWSQVFSTSEGFNDVLEMIREKIHAKEAHRGRQGGDQRQPGSRTGSSEDTPW